MGRAVRFSCLVALRHSAISTMKHHGRDLTQIRRRRLRCQSPNHGGRRKSQRVARVQSLRRQRSIPVRPHHHVRTPSIELAQVIEAVVADPNSASTDLMSLCADTWPAATSCFPLREKLPEKLYIIGCEYDMLCHEAEVMCEHLAKSERGEKRMIRNDRSCWQEGNLRWETVL